MFSIILTSYDCMITDTYFLNLTFGIILSRHHKVGGPQTDRFQLVGRLYY